MGSCSSPEQPIPSPVFVQHKPVTILGRVVLAQALGILTPPFSDVSISIEGTSFSAVSNDSGYFTLHDVPVGTYTAHFSKPGYGDVRWISIHVTDSVDTVAYWYRDNNVAMLYKVSNEVATLRGLSDRLGYGYVIASGDIKPDRRRPQTEDAVVIFFSHTSDVSAAPGHYATFIYYIPYGSLFGNSIDSTKETFSYALDVVDPAGSVFKSGDSIYAAAFGAPYYRVGIITIRPSVRKSSQPSTKPPLR